MWWSVVGSLLNQNSANADAAKQDEEYKKQAARDKIMNRRAMQAQAKNELAAGVDINGMVNSVFTNKKSKLGGFNGI